MKRQLINVFLTLALALGLCAGASAAEAADGAISVSGLTGGQYTFVAGYDETGRFLGTRVLTADGDARPIPGAVEMKLFRTDGTFAPQSEAVILNADCQTVRKIDGRVTLCYEGPDGVAVTQPVTRKITGRVLSWGWGCGLRINDQFYPATALTVEGCDYDISKDGFADWASQPGLPLWDDLDFYVDPWGNICWIDLVAEHVYPARTQLILSAGVAGTPDGGTAVRAELLRASGTVETVDVSSLDGQPITDPDAAAAQLSAHAPGGFYACRRQRDGTYSLTATQNAPGSGWGRTLTIPPDTVTAPEADFTQDAINCLANNKTRFVVSRGLPGEEKLTDYVGYRDLPAVTVLEGAVVTAEGDPTVTPVARFVYLRTLDEVPVEPPAGYVFIAENRALIRPGVETTYAVPIVDAEGTASTLPVNKMLKDAIITDSMYAGQFPGNAYVGKFCAVTRMDRNGVVTGLAPADASELSILGDGVITTAASAGVWSDYDNVTRCVYVDLYQDADGLVSLTDSGAFDPDSGFIDLCDVSSDPASGATYRSAKAALIFPEGSNVADYIYVVRELW